MYIEDLIVPITLVAVVIIAIVVWGIVTANRFKVFLVKINEADSGIDIALTKRYDTLIKLVDAVASFAEHEVSTLGKIVEMRSGMRTLEKAELSGQYNEIVRGINVIAEQYPQLRSSDNFVQLQSSIVETEDHLQASRRVFNMNISSFNQAIVQFPASIIARLYKYAQKEFFEAETEKRADVNVRIKVSKEG